MLSTARCVMHDATILPYSIPYSFSSFFPSGSGIGSACVVLYLYPIFLKYCMYEVLRIDACLSEIRRVGNLIRSEDPGDWRAEVDASAMSCATES